MLLKTSISISTFVFGVMLATSLLPSEAYDTSHAREVMHHLTNRSTNQPVKQKGNLNNLNDKFYKHLTEAPSELPGLPLPGVKEGSFISGLQRSEKQGTVLCLTYQMKKPKDVVMGQYIEALQNNNWNVINNQSGNRAMASMHGNLVIVNTSMNVGGSYPTTLQLNYTLKGN